MIIISSLSMIYISELACLTYSDRVVVRVSHLDGIHEDHEHHRTKSVGDFHFLFQLSLLPVGVTGGIVLAEEPCRLQAPVTVTMIYIYREDCWARAGLSYPARMSHRVFITPPLLS